MRFILLVEAFASTKQDDMTRQELSLQKDSLVVEMKFNFPSTYEREEMCSVGERKLVEMNVAEIL